MDEFIKIMMAFVLGMLFTFDLALAIYRDRLISMLTGAKGDYKEEFAPGGTDVKSYIKCPLCLEYTKGHSSDKIHLGDIRWR